MKKFLLVLSFSLFNSCLVFSQTKEETEKWIIEKLSKYAVKTITCFNIGTKKDCANAKDFQYKIVNGNLIISYNYSDYSSLYRITPKKYHVPIGALDFDRSYIDGNEFVLKTKSFCIKQYVNGVLDKELVNAAYIGFNNSGEENLMLRMIKALKHLVTFYPIETENEPF